MEDKIKRIRDLNNKIKNLIHCISTTFHSQMTEKTNQSEKYMKNVCAVSNFVQVILTKGYGFNEHSFPSISFQKKVRSKGNTLNIFVHLLGFQSVTTDSYQQRCLKFLKSGSLAMLFCGFSGSPLVFLQAGGASVGWALGYMLSQSNIVQAESLGLMKALPSGPWTGILFLFITLLLIAVGYLIMIYRTRNREAMV